MNNFFNANLAEADPIIAQAINNETKRQSNGLELIASENFVSEAVLQAAGSSLPSMYNRTWVAVLAGRPS